MRLYDVQFAPAARRQLATVPEADRRKVARAVTALAANPRPLGCRKLAGSEVWRVRVGRYRILYCIVDEQLVVLIVKIGHRKDVYR